MGQTLRGLALNPSLTVISWCSTTTTKLVDIPSLVIVCVSTDSPDNRGRFSHTVCLPDQYCRSYGQWSHRSTECQLYATIFLYYNFEPLCTVHLFMSARHCCRVVITSMVLHPCLTCKRSLTALIIRFCTVTPPSYCCQLSSHFEWQQAKGL